MPEELCTRLRQATQSAPGLALRNPRIGALVAACAAAQPTTSSGSAGAGSAAAGSGPAATGDAPSAASTTGSFDGTAVFTRAADGVDLLIVLDGCKDAALYPVHIHEGHSCSSAMSLGEHWDRPRGEDIPDLRCSGSHVAATYTRLDSEPKSWSLGGPSASDVIGHVLVVNDPDDRTLPVACGVIQAP